MPQLFFFTYSVFSFAYRCPLCLYKVFKWWCYCHVCTAIKYNNVTM